MNVMTVAGARPNFMKIAPWIHELQRHNRTAPPEERVRHVLLHTGQHYDENMSGVFFKTLNIPFPDINLEVGSGTHAEQIGQTMIRFEAALLQAAPDWVIVVGDVNAVCACSIIAKKYGVLVAHLEAGLRSGDLGMPEEINRIVADRLTDLYLVPDRFAQENLLREGVDEARIAVIGNIMIDTLEKHRDEAAALDPDVIVTSLADPDAGASRGIGQERYGVVTLHRPANVDDPARLSVILDFLGMVAASDGHVVWPVHPRTKKRLQNDGLWTKLASNSRILLLTPIDYLSMLRLNLGAAWMITDSGGLQEECSVLGTPCMTLRPNTERPITLHEYCGTCWLVPEVTDEALRSIFLQISAAERTPSRPEFWDGQAAGRLLEALLAYPSVRG